MLLRTVSLSICLALAACSNGEETNKRSKTTDASDSSNSTAKEGTSTSFSLTLPDEFKVGEKEVSTEAYKPSAKPIRSRVICDGKDKTYSSAPFYFAKIALDIKIAGTEEENLSETLIYACHGNASISISPIEIGATLTMSATFYDHKGVARFHGDLEPVVAGKETVTKMVMKRTDKDGKVLVDIVFEKENNPDTPPPPKPIPKPEGPINQPTKPTPPTMVCEDTTPCASVEEFEGRCSVSFFVDDMGFLIEKKASNSCSARNLVMQELCEYKLKYPNGKQAGLILCSSQGGGIGISNPYEKEEVDPKEPTKDESIEEANNSNQVDADVPQVSEGNNDSGGDGSDSAIGQNDSGDSADQQVNDVNSEDKSEQGPRSSMVIQQLLEDDQHKVKVELLVGGKVQQSEVFESPGKGNTIELKDMCRSQRETCVRITFIGAITQTAGASSCTFVKTIKPTKLKIDADTNGAGFLGSCSPGEDESYTFECPNSQSLKIQKCTE